ncbi:MAG: 2-aminoadipate transaminase, partial [Pseudonocardiales bacterium]|nr:2-aminoadipate transaminase [Pseudonocardiales bacterium]
MIPSPSTRSQPGNELVRPTSKPPPDTWRPSVVQDVAPAGMYDLGPGYLGPDLLPVSLLADAYASALTGYGAAALSYGTNAGALPLRELLAERAAAADGVACIADQVVITAGTSMALQLICATMASRGEVALVDEVAYDYGLQILHDSGLRIERIPGDEAGMHPEALSDRLASIRAQDVRASVLYLNPTFQNPLGFTLPDRRRQELIDVAARSGLLIIEDDAYAELPLEPVPIPPSLAALSGYGNVIRLCSFSKVLGPGLRLGWMLTNSGLARQLLAHGVFVSGGALNHTTSLAVTTLLADGRYDEHLHRLRQELWDRRQTLTDTLLGALGTHIRLRPSAGGFFRW